MGMGRYLRGEIVSRDLLVLRDCGPRVTVATYRFQIVLQSAASSEDSPSQIWIQGAGLINYSVILVSR